MRARKIIEDLDEGGGETLVDAVFRVHADQDAFVVICWDFKLDWIGRARPPLAPDLTIENNFSVAVFSAPVNLEVPAWLAKNTRRLLHIGTCLVYVAGRKVLSCLKAIQNPI